MNWTTYNNAGAALSQSLTDMPVGTITGYAGTTAPSGWLLCDGAAVSRTTYAELFGVVSTTYGSGDGSTTFNVPDSSGFIILASSQAARLAAAALPQYVTSLPSSPVDGQTVVYAADATNGVMWTLRYRAASSSSYKWEFIGGAPMRYEKLGGTTDTITSATYANLPTTGTAAKITTPVAGDYNVTLTARSDQGSNGAGQQVWVAVKVGSASASDDQAVSNRNENWTSIGRVFTLTAVAASADLLLQARTTTSGGRVFDLGFHVTPVRVG